MICEENEMATNWDNELKAKLATMNRKDLENYAYEQRMAWERAEKARIELNNSVLRVNGIPIPY